ncbi:MULTISPECIES: ATP-binding protein [Bacillus cereus group]|uniref:ATP-binding protein n=1 Tax=Bacillus cereus group TaxID=86661 RepID=UPI00124DEDFD|nr:ATP-binding protein [Bacillus cereus]KAB2425455.1 ATP-binding protein [Bacillus cereus]
MELKQIYIRNFRGYEEERIEFNEGMNLLIGRNDVGKSTIMDALEIFFNGDSKGALVKAEIEDCNVNSTVKEMEITACFKLGDEEEISIDSSNTTNLKEEYLLNKDGLLEVKKLWDCSKSNLTANSLKVMVNANYPQILSKPLINMKQLDLKKEIESVKDVLVDYDKINKSKNAELRKALYQHYITESTDFEETVIEIKKIETDEKDLWKKIKDSLPLFFLFQADRSNSDSDNEVQNPLKIATKKALAEIEQELEKIKGFVDETVSKIGELTIDKLQDFDPNIASKLKTRMNLKSWDSLFSFDLESDDGISLNKRGSGVKRLILLSYFRAEAERISSEENNKNIIYGIEEPETSQHPDFQKMIIESLRSISEDIKHQVIITTHTPEIAKMVDVEEIIFIKKENNTPKVVKEDILKIRGIVDTLGILPTIESKVVICVEGENDVNFIMNINQSIQELRDIIDLKEHKISILPLSGSQLIRWVNRNYLSNSNVIEFHIYDADKQEYKDVIDKMKIDNDGRRYGTITERLEMENYIPPNLIQEQFKIDLDIQNAEWEKLDVPKYLLDRILANIKCTKEREMKIKEILNGSITKKMTKIHLEEMGCFEEIKSWFEQVHSLYFGSESKPKKRMAKATVLKSDEVKVPQPTN